MTQSPKPKLTRLEVEHTLQQAREQAQTPDLGEANLYGVDLSGLDLSRIDLSGADLGRANLYQADLTEALLRGTNFFEANLSQATLTAANLERANLHGAFLKKANLGDAGLQQANLFEVNLNRASLAEASLVQVDLSGAYLNWATFREANLKRANLAGASLRGTDFSYADLREANLNRASLIQTNFIGAKLNGCSIYGISAWKLKLDGTDQRDLLISSPRKPGIIVDGLEMAQFIDLLLESHKIREAVDIVGKKTVLILGYFPGQRAGILDGLRDSLRASGYLPLFFDFETHLDEHLNDMLYVLAHLAHFIIADITETEVIQPALERLVPYLPSIPVQPLLHSAAPEDSLLFVYQENYPWILPFYRYDDLPHLSQNFKENVLTPAETKAKNIATRRQLAAEVEARRKG